MISRGGGSLAARTAFVWKGDRRRIFRGNDSYHIFFFYAGSGALGTFGPELLCRLTELLHAAHWPQMGCISHCLEEVGRDAYSRRAERMG